MEIFWPPREEEEKETRAWYKSMLESPTVRGGLLGAFITAFVSWNSGPHGRIGKFLKHWKFVRHFVSPKPISNFCHITNYHYTHLDVAANNFYCYSGESGIGKSKHFQELVAQESYSRPTLYVSFKAVGREANFDIDLAEQINYGPAIGIPGGIIGEIVRAVKDIHFINENAHDFKMKYYLTNTGLALGALLTCLLPMVLQIKVAILGPMWLFQWQYFKFMRPLVEQARRRSIPVIVFDDVNKLQSLNMLAEITRFFKILEAKSANLIMISSNEETWAKLRREPGMKDRLRIRQIKYNHTETAEMLITMCETRPEDIQKYFHYHPLFTMGLIKELARIFIGRKQMSIRRFTSVLKLVDEEEYEEMVRLLKNEKRLAAADVVQFLSDVIFQTEVHTVVSHLRSIKRQLPQMSHKVYMQTLRVACMRRKLPSDNRVGALLKLYNIMRDMRSEYVINGGYMSRIFENSIEEYRREMQQFDLPDEHHRAHP